MVTKPATPHADEILGNQWEEQFTPATLIGRSNSLRQKASDTIAGAGDGVAQAMFMSSYNTGVLIDAMVAAWTQYFKQLGQIGAQVAAISAQYDIWASTLGAALSAMANVVFLAEEDIALIESQRAALLAAKQDPDKLIKAVIDEAKNAVRGIAAGASFLTPEGFAAAPSTPTKAAGGQRPGRGGQTGQNQPRIGAAAGLSNKSGRAGGTEGSHEAEAVPAASVDRSGRAGGTGQNGQSSQVGGGNTGGGGHSGGGSSGSNGSPNAGGSSHGSGTGGASSGTGGGSGSGAGGTGHSGGASQSGSPGSGSPHGSPSSTGNGGNSSHSPAASTTHPSGTSSTGATQLTPGMPLGAAPLGIVNGVAGAAAQAAPGVAAGAGAAAAGATGAANLAASQAPASQPTPAPQVPVTPSPTNAAFTPPPPMTTSAAPVQGGAVAATAPSGGGPTQAATPSPAQQQGPTHPPGGHSTTNTPSNGQVSTLGQVSPIVPVAAEAAGVAAVGFVGTPETPGAAVTEAPELLSVRSVLEAAGGGEVQWAAGLFVTGGRQQLVVTTDRGRGWMPAQVLLPRDVVMPWRDRRSGAWEGLNDPMRVLLEWGAVQRSGEWIAISGTRASASEVLTKAPFTLADVGSDPRGVGRDQDRVPRGFFAVRPDLASAADEIEGDRAQREQGLWLAMDSLKRAGVGGTAAEICNSMFADRELLRPSKLDELPWESLERQHNVLSLEELRARRDVRDIPLGLLEEGPAATSREKLIQLYALESVLALNQVSPGQVLADALYSWSVQQDASRAGKAVAV